MKISVFFPMTRFAGLYILAFVSHSFAVASPAHGQPAEARPATTAITAPRSVAEQYLFASVNAERSAAGLPALVWNDTLVQAARYHANRMAVRHDLSHQLDGEPDLLQRAGSTGTHFSRVTENVALGTSILQIHDALMHSPHHRENILDRGVNSVAVSVIGSEGELWAVEDFAQDLGTISLPDQEEHVLALLAVSGLQVAVTEDARATCRQSSGYVGKRPGFVMRYVTSDLDRLPAQLSIKLAQPLYASAAIGACAAPESHGFTSYNIAVLLYR